MSCNHVFSVSIRISGHSIVSVNSPIGHRTYYIIVTTLLRSNLITPVTGAVIFTFSSPTIDSIFHRRIEFEQVRVVPQITIRTHDILNRRSGSSGRHTAESNDLRVRRDIANITVTICSKREPIRAGSRLHDSSDIRFSFRNIVDRYSCKLRAIKVPNARYETNLQLVARYRRLYFAHSNIEEAAECRPIRIAGRTEVDIALTCVRSIYLVFSTLTFRIPSFVLTGNAHYFNTVTFSQRIVQFILAFYFGCLERMRLISNHIPIGDGTYEIIIRLLNRSISNTLCVQFHRMRIRMEDDRYVIHTFRQFVGIPITAYRPGGSPIMIEDDLIFHFSGRKIHILRGPLIMRFNKSHLGSGALLVPFCTE